MWIAALARCSCLWLAAALCACGGEGTGEPAEAAPQTPTPRVVLGTGEAVFEALEGEPALPLVAGVQGGFHAWASLLAYDFSARRLDMLLETRTDDDPATRLEMRSRLSLRDTLDAAGNPALLFAGFPAQVADARCANGKRVSVHVTLSGPAGDSAEDTRHYIAELAPAQRSDACE